MEWRKCINEENNLTEQGWGLNAVLHTRVANYLWWEVSLFLASFPNNTLNFAAKSIHKHANSPWIYFFIYEHRFLTTSFTHPQPTKKTKREKKETSPGETWWILSIPETNCHFLLLPWFQILDSTKENIVCVTLHNQGGRNLAWAMREKGWVTISALRNGSPAADWGHTGSATRPAGTSPVTSQKEATRTSQSELGQLTHL